MNASPTPAISVRELTVTFGGEIPVLRDVNLDIAAGEFLAVAGPNGGGKTTLIRAMLGLAPRVGGRVEVRGESIDDLRAREQLGYLAQRTTLGVEGPVTVEEVVRSGCVRRGAWLGRLSADDRRRADDALSRVGLSDRARSQVATLSGGQQQRVFLAKVLAGSPSIIMLDEPTTGVDAGSQEMFAELLCELNRDLGVTIVYVSHEFGAVEPHVSRIVLVNGGITFDGPPHELGAQWHDPSHHHDHGCNHA